MKRQRYHFADKRLYSQSYWFSSSHVRMWELNHKEGWVLKNWCSQIVMLEKTPESPVDCKEIQPVNSQGIQSWILSLEGLLLKLKLQYFCHLMWRVDSLEKNPDAGKDWRQERTRQQRMRCLDSTTDSVDMNLCKLEDIEEWGSLACCSPWGHKLLDTI